MIYECHTTHSVFKYSDEILKAAEKAGTPAPAKKPPTSSTPSSVRSVTPINPVIESLRGDLDSRPQTPTVVGLDKDEREDFLRRENELSDQLAERESALAAVNKLVGELREELTFLKEQEASLSKVRTLVSAFPRAPVECLLTGACFMMCRRTRPCPATLTSSASKWSASIMITRRA